MRRSTATQRFVWRSSRLSGDLYAAVHSYSSGAVPDCRGIYTMATQQFVWCSSRLSGDFYVAVHSYSANYMAQMAQFPTVGGFLCSSPQLFRNLHGAVPDCREVYVWRPMATEGFVWRNSRLSGDSIRRSTATQQFTWRSSRLSGDFYAAVHSYSAIYMAQFPTVGRFIYGGPQLLSNLHGTVPDCREIYMRRSTATQ